MDLYSAFIVVPHTQGAQVWITQCYLQIVVVVRSKAINHLHLVVVLIVSSGGRSILIYLENTSGI